MQVIAALHGEVLPVHARLERPVDSLLEVVAVGLNMEPDEVRSQHAIQQFALPRADAERLRIGPWDVPEDRHSRVGALLLDHARQQREMVILHQNHGRRLIAHFVQHRCREFPVHDTILFPNPRRGIPVSCGRCGTKGQSPSLAKAEN